MANLTPEEERVLRSLLKKKSGTRRRKKPASAKIQSKLANDALANMILLLILLVIAIGLVTR